MPLIVVPNAAEVESQVIPWLMEAVENRLSRTEIARKLLDSKFHFLLLCC
jgi:hypothetical protein